LLRRKCISSRLGYPALPEYLTSGQTRAQDHCWGSPTAALRTAGGSITSLPAISDVAT
jgi:hypothetical protein